MQNVVRYFRCLPHTQSWSVVRQSSKTTPWHQYHPWLRFGPVMQRHGAKSKSTVKLDDLPQGALEPAPEPAEKEDEGPIYPTVVRQARNNMQKFDRCVVLTRVGSFYEVRSLPNPSIVSTETGPSFTLSKQSSMVHCSISKWPRRRARPAYPQSPWSVTLRTIVVQR